MRPEALSGRAPRLHEQVIEELQQRMLDLTLPPGQRLTEARIAAELGVSRTPVRAALRELESLGWLLIDDNKSYVVGPKATEGKFRKRSGPRRPLKSVASWQTIYREVSQEAVARAAYGSWRIIEAELAATYRVSRTVAREVLARLEHVGILRKDNRSRWVLPALTRKRIEQLYEMRWVLEPIALRKAAVHSPESVLRKMKQELEVVIASPGLAPPEEFARLEEQLHVGLLSFGDNGLMLETLQHYHALLITNAQLYQATRHAFGSDPFMGEHLQIVEALLAADTERAVALMEHHLHVALDRALARTDFMVANLRYRPLAYLKPLDG